QVHPRSDYGISGKTTDIVLADPAANDTPALWPAPDMTTLRGTQVYAQSEALPLAELVITDIVGTTTANDGTARITQDDATHLTLDGAVDGLKPGRWVVVQGQRTNANLPGDTVHSTLVFANQGLAYAYQRDTVTVCANVVRATHGETRNE